MLWVPRQERRTSQLHPDRGAELPHGMHCAKSQREKNPPKTTWPWLGVKAPGSYVPGSNTADWKLQRFPVDSVLFSWPNFFQTVNSCKSSTEPSINLVKSWLIPEQRNVLIVILARNAYIVIGLRVQSIALEQRYCPPATSSFSISQRSSFLQHVCRLNYQVRMKVCDGRTGALQLQLSSLTPNAEANAMWKLLPNRKRKANSPGQSETCKYNHDLCHLQHNGKLLIKVPIVSGM